MELVVATNNAGKLREIRAMLPGAQLLTLSDIGYTQSIDEPFFTFEENARVKAETIFNFCGKPVLADDSGICVDALDGAPGVHSARFAGPAPTDGENLQHLLAQMEGKTDRSARYVAVICLFRNGTAHYFRGTCEGTITIAPAGDGGFGYDPVFRPTGYEQTFGELDPAVKHLLSHRGAAIRQMAAFLEENPLF